MEDGTVEPLDAPALMHHALRSEVVGLITGFAHSVIASDTESLELLAPFLAELALQPTGAPIFPKGLAASAFLQFAHLLALLPHGTAEQA